MNYCAGEIVEVFYANKWLLGKIMTTVGGYYEEGLRLDIRIFNSTGWLGRRRVLWSVLSPKIRKVP